MANPPTKLIIVCCHGIWLGGPTAGHSEDEWLIADYQRGETPIFIHHMRLALAHSSSDPTRSIVIFSGAPTRRETPLSEAHSYASLVRQNAFFGFPAPSIMLEERALDSYHNVLFSLAGWWDRFGSVPTEVVIVSHAFKERRIMSHVRGIKFPLGRVVFDGGEWHGEVSPGVREAERDWELDPAGEGEKLAGKRARRNVWGVRQGVFEGEGVGEWPWVGL